MSEHMHSFSINVVGDTTQEQWVGLFKVKTRLSHRDHLNRDRIRREMLGPNPQGVSPRADSIAEIFSQLSVRIVDAPSWWKDQGGGMDLADDNVVAKVYDEAMKAEADLAKSLKEKADLAKKALETSNL